MEITGRMRGAYTKKYSFWIFDDYMYAPVVYMRFSCAENFAI